MRSEKLQGIILKRSNFSEADKILTIFTGSHGKIKVIAKGIRKIKSRRAPHLQLFCQVEIMVHHGKTFDIVTEAKMLRTFTEPFTRDPLAKLELAGYLFYLSEVLDRMLPEHQPHPNVYTSLLRTLSDLSNIDDSPGKGNSQQDKVKQFVVQLLWSLGYLPHGLYPKQGITAMVESTIEKPIRSKKFLEEI